MTATSSKIGRIERGTRRREFLTPLLIAAFFAVTIASVSAYGLGQINKGRLAIDLAIGCVVSVVPLLLIRRGLVSTGIWLSLTAIFAAISWVAWTSGGISAPWVVFQLLSVSMASFLVERRWALFVALIVSVIDAVIIYAASHAMLPPSQVAMQPLYTLLVLTMGSLFAVMMITRFVASLEGALDRTRTELTNREAAEKELAKSHREYQQLVAMVPGIVFKFRANPDGSYTFPFVSEGIEGLTGLPAAEMMADPARVVQLALPEARPALLQSISVAAVGRTAWQYEMPIRATDGAAKWIRVHAVPTGVDEEGRPIWHGTLFDFTERRRTEDQLRESEERFRTLAESIPQVFWIADHPGGFVYVSPAVTTIWGVTPAEILADGRRWFGAVHVDDRARVMTKFAQWVAATETGSYQELYQLMRADGTIRWVESRVTLRQRLADGRTRVGGTVTDVTDRRRAEEEARAAEHESHQRQKLEALGTLAGGIAHDFNNLLTVILGYSELARLETPAMSAFLEPVSVAGQRARDLVRRILLFSRPTSEERRPIRLGQLVTEAVGLLRATLPKSIELDWCPPAEDPVVIADSSQISQALMNLGVNAGHSMPAETGRIVLRLAAVNVDEEEASRRQIVPGKYVIVAVEDNGSGMEPAVVLRIFEPFFTTKPLGQGTGLGLAVVHSIIHNHDGTIVAESRPGVGTTFRIWLPAAVSTPAPAVRPGSASATVPFGAGREIMVVEDQVEVLATSCAMLERLGFKPIGLADPVEAVRVFSESGERFTAVLSDRSMPQMGGLEVGRAVSTARPGTPFILMTGYEGGIGPDALAQAGVSAVLAKPAGLSELAEVLRDQVGVG